VCVCVCVCVGTAGTGKYVLRRAHEGPVDGLGFCVHVSPIIAPGNRFSRVSVVVCIRYNKARADKELVAIAVFTRHIVLCMTYARLRILFTRIARHMVGTLVR